jgi:CMP-N,N'-diacetyllegionaminic acid synthase
LNVNILGLIPARGGSKAIPHKNIVLLAGKPLLAYTCQAGLASRTLTRLVLNTDDRAIAEVGREYGVETPFLRPASLAADDTPILPVIQHAVEWMEVNEGFYTEVVVLLQPTSPFRKSAHIDAALDLLLDSDADNVVSVLAVPHNFNPVSVMQLDDRGYLKPSLKGDLILRRQDKPRVYARNGPAVLAVRREVIDTGRLYGDKVLPFEMDPIASLDIDDENDLRIAEALLRYDRDLG